MLTLPRIPHLERTPRSAAADLRWAWSRTDRIFDIAPKAWFERPIPLRHPLIFYLGHLPAFAWNHIGRGFLGQPSRRPEFDELFERGIDPLDDEQSAEVSITDWPPVEEVIAYRDAVRADLPGVIERIWDMPADPYVAEGRIVDLVIEHELMHHETLLYILRELDHSRKQRPFDAPAYLSTAAPPKRRIAIPAGRTTLGAAWEGRFGWDNEFPEQELQVDAFGLDDLPVTVDEFEQFVHAGGYEARELWTDADWEWIRSTGRGEPHGWRRAKGELFVRALLDDVPRSVAGSWPAIVSGAEARAYARWKGTRLPSEAELQRAAYGTPSGEEHSWPWGDDEPEERHGNFDLRRLSPTPVGSSPAGRSAFGVHELIGNAWEWTSSVFEPWSGFRPIPTYPGYSADFFDGQHLVLFGGSWGTDVQLLRRSFRNWFQPHYPYVLSGFRLAWD